MYRSGLAPSIPDFTRHHHAERTAHALRKGQQEPDHHLGRMHRLVRGPGAPLPERAAASAWSAPPTRACRSTRAWSAPTACSTATQLKREGRPVFFNNNGIHPGEPEGVDACMALVRDFCIAAGAPGRAGQDRVPVRPAVQRRRQPESRQHLAREPGRPGAVRLPRQQPPPRPEPRLRQVRHADRAGVQQAVHRVGPGRDGRHPHLQRRRLHLHHDADPHPGRQAWRRAGRLPARHHAAAHVRARWSSAAGRPARTSTRSRTARTTASPNSSKRRASRPATRPCTTRSASCPRRTCSSRSPTATTRCARWSKRRSTSRWRNADQIQQLRRAAKDEGKTRARVADPLGDGRSEAVDLPLQGLRGASTRRACSATTRACRTTAASRGSATSPTSTASRPTSR